MATIRNKKTGEVKKVSNEELVKYGLGGNVDMAKKNKKFGNGGAPMSKNEYKKYPTLPFNANVSEESFTKNGKLDDAAYYNAWKLAQSIPQLPNPYFGKDSIPTSELSTLQRADGMNMGYGERNNNNNTGAQNELYELFKNPSNNRDSVLNVMEKKYPYNASGMPENKYGGRVKKAQNGYGIPNQLPVDNTRINTFLQSNNPGLVNDPQPLDDHEIAQYRKKTGNYNPNPPVDLGFHRPIPIATDSFLSSENIINSVMKNHDYSNDSKQGYMGSQSDGSIRFKDGGKVGVAKNGKKIKMKLKKADVGTTVGEKNAFKQFINRVNNNPGFQTNSFGVEQDPEGIVDDSNHTFPTGQQMGLPEFVKTPDFNPGLTDSLMQYNKKNHLNYSPTLNPDEQTQLNDFQAKNKLNINFQQPNFTPIVGNKYLQQSMRDFQRAGTFASNIGKQNNYNVPMFKSGGLMRYDFGGNNANDLHYNFGNQDNQFGTIGGIAGTVANTGLGINHAIKGTLDIAGSYLQNEEEQKRNAQQFTQSVYSQAMDNRPQDYILNRNDLAENGMQIKEIGGKGQPNVEVEGKETIMLPDGFSQKIQGDSHAQGGIPLSLPANTKIFSEKLKVDTDNGKKSYSQLAKPFETKKNVDMLEAKGADDIQKSTAEMMIKFKKDKLEQLFNFQEQQKLRGAHGNTVMQGAMDDYGFNQQDEPETQDNPQEEQFEPSKKYGGLMKAGAGKTLRGTGKDAVNNFNNLDEVYQNYKAHGYNGAKDITQMREWSYKKDPQGVNAYILSSRPTNEHRRIWKQEYKGTGEPDLLKMKREDVFRGYNDKLWDYRAYKFTDAPTVPPTIPPVTPPNTPPDIQFKDRYQYLKPNVNIDGINFGVPLPDMLERGKLNFYNTNPNYIDPRYLNNQQDRNAVSETQRGFQNNLGSRGTGDVSNLLQGQVNAYKQFNELGQQKWNYDRNQDNTAQTFNAQAKTRNDEFNQGNWFNQLENPSRQIDSAIGDQMLTDQYRGMERADQQFAYNNTKNFIDKRFGQYQNLNPQDIVNQIYGSNNFNYFNPNDNTNTVITYDRNGNIISRKEAENKAYGGKVKLKIKPKLKK